MHLSHIDAQLDYEVVAPAHLLLNIEAARSGAQAVVSEALSIEPPAEMQVFCDEGSGNRFIRFDARPGPLKISYRASVQRTHLIVPPDLREVPVNQVPDEVLHYMMPTRYCESDLMSRCAQQLFGDLPPGIGRVQAIVDWIHDSIAYEPGSSVSTTTAREVFVERAGVCRDFAHLGITFCRALNIPARLVVGYVWFDEPPQDFPRGVRSVAGRAVGAVRSDAHGAGRPAGARGHGARRQGRGLLHDLRQRAHDRQVPGHPRAAGREPAAVEGAAAERGAGGHRETGACGAGGRSHRLTRVVCY
jgi:hypothetical protein